MSYASCTVIIPVYNAFEEAVRCLASVIALSPEARRILVIDDASREGLFQEKLRQSGIHDPRLEVIRNEVNLGFVKSCNAGMKRADPDDVVLLNSDTEVTPRWLSKMQRAAHSGRDVGTVTAFTNNGTIVSLPTMSVSNEIPAGYTLHEFSDLVERVSARAYPRLPTCIGHCVYIRRALLNTIGYFDEVAFGRGYGEENDLSVRAQRAGFVDILDDATFIYHKGQASFLGDTEQLSKENTKALLGKYPLFFEDVGQYCRDGVLHPAQSRIWDEMVTRWRSSKRGSVLHVVHNGPFKPRHHPLGGTELHVGDMIRSMPDMAHWSLVPSRQCYYLTAHLPGFDREYILALDQTNLKTIFSRDFFDLVHVHHSRYLDHAEVCAALPGTNDYVISFHDFILVCPRFHLLTPDRRMCNGHECVQSCSYSKEYIQEYRESARGLFASARALVTFSDSTRDLIRRIVPGEFNWKTVPHGITLRTERGEPRHAESPLSEGRPFRVAFVGYLPQHKGALIIDKIIDQTTVGAKKTPIEWHVFGKLFMEAQGRVIDHGAYESGALPELLRAAEIDCVAILSICPETYCLTLDESWAGGVPVLVTPLGAPAERVSRSGAGWVVSRLDPEAVLSQLGAIADDWALYSKAAANLSRVTLRTVESEGASFYEMYRTIGAVDRNISQSALFAYLQRFVLRRAPEPSSVKRIVGKVFHHGIVMIERARLRPALEGMLYKVFPRKVLESIKSLRQNAS